MLAAQNGSDDGSGGHFGCQSADLSQVGTRQRLGREREDRISVEGNVCGIDAACKAVVSHLRDLRHARFFEGGVGRHHCQRCVFSGAPQAEQLRIGS